MPGILDRLKTGEILLCDGAIGTMLFARGLKPGECPDRVNLEQPDWVREIAAAYKQAGSDIVTTNTFGGSPLKLRQYSLDHRCEEINRLGVRLVREAVGESTLVAGCVGPCGKLLKPYGDTDPQEVFDGFKTQVSALVDEGADVILVETMTDLNEALLALEAARETSSSIPVSVALTYEVTPRGIFTIMGNTPNQACAALKDAGADILGSNCGNGIINMVAIAAEYMSHSELPVIIQSNAGLPETKDGQAVYMETPQYMAGKVRKLVEMGVSIIGGCCGTTPRHIAAMRDVIPQKGA